MPRLIKTLSSQLRTHWVLILTICIAIGLRFYRLDEIPGETFGDMVENIEHVQAVKRGEWKLIYGFDGREGLYFYISAVSSFIWGDSYFNLKFVTALIGLATVVSTYALTKQLTNEKTALLAAFLVAVSKWPLVYSRIGFRTVLTPLFASIVFLFFFRSLRSKKLKDMVVVAFFLGLGLYTYTAFKVVVIDVVFLIGFVTIRYGLPTRKTVKNFAISCIVFFAVALPQFIDMVRAPELYLSHTGPMIMVDGKLPKEWFSKLKSNFVNQAGMLHWQGDSISRVNPMYEPELDIISGIFFIIGILGIIILYRNTAFFMVGITYIVLQLPSILVLNLDGNVPSATRTTSIIPFVFLIVAVGIEIMSRVLPNIFLQKYFIFIVLLFIFISNYFAYFERYADGLPNRNVAFDKIIASYIDAAPQTETVYLVGGAWGESGQPHPRGITHNQHTDHPIKMIEIMSDDQPNGVCHLLELPPNAQFLVISNPYFVHLPTEECFREKYQKMIKTRYGDNIFFAISTQPIQ